MKESDYLHIKNKTFYSVRYFDHDNKDKTYWGNYTCFTVLADNDRECFDIIEREFNGFTITCCGVYKSMPSSSNIIESIKRSEKHTIKTDSESVCLFKIFD